MKKNLITFFGTVIIFFVVILGYIFWSGKEHTNDFTKSENPSGWQVVDSVQSSHFALPIPFEATPISDRSDNISKIQEQNFTSKDPRMAYSVNLTAIVPPEWFQIRMRMMPLSSNKNVYQLIDRYIKINSELQASKGYQIKWNDTANEPTNKIHTYFPHTPLHPIPKINGNDVLYLNSILTNPKSQTFTQHNFVWLDHGKFYILTVIYPTADEDTGLEFADKVTKSFTLKSN